MTQTTMVLPARRRLQETKEQDDDLQHNQANLLEEKHLQSEDSEGEVYFDVPLDGGSCQTNEDGEVVGSASMVEHFTSEVGFGNPYGESWKEFDHDTEAGRLLRKLYTRSHNKPLKSYPRLRVKKSDQSECKPTWSNVQPYSDDPHTNRERRDREKNVLAPRMSNSVATGKVPAIFTVPKKKSMEQIAYDIQTRLDDIKTHRPIARKAVSTDLEKRKLAMHFQFKGGKALPENGTIRPIDGQIPLSLLTGKPKKVAEKSKERRDEAQRLERIQEQEVLEREFDQCALEVNQLEQSITMLETNRSHGAVRKISQLKQQLHTRISDMEQIDETIRTLKAL